MTWLRRGSVISVASVLLLTVGDSVVYTQIPLPPNPPSIDLPKPPAIPPVNLANQYVPSDIKKLPPLSVTSPAPLATSVDDLMAQLESVRKQKAEIETKEKAILQQLRAHLKDQKERLKKLGVDETVDPPTAKVETVVPRVITPAKSGSSE